MPLQRIRVLVVEDSLFFREFLTRSLSRDLSLEIVGSFSDPIEAQGHISRLQPDVMAVDMEMPKMRGDEFIRTVLPKYPQTKAIVISALSNNVFDAMAAGAVDFVSKPNTRPNYDNSMFLLEVVRKIKTAAAATSRVSAMPPQQRAQPGAPGARPNRRLRRFRRRPPYRTCPA
jgi:two-component system chemotaxis response regulator CheB